MFESTTSDGVLQVTQPSARWLSTGWNGGLQETATAYNVTVPEGWEETDLTAYVRKRLDDAGFRTDGPTLLTGVKQKHARGARYGPVVAYATVGLTNPAPLPVDDAETGLDTSVDGSKGVGSTDHSNAQRQGETADGKEPFEPGTVNLLVGTTRRLDDGALANLVSVVAEAKATTLLAATPFPGTTTDAIVVGSDRTGERAPFSGSATAVGNAARISVRDAVLASLRSRYPDGNVPQSVDAVDYGVEPTGTARVFRPGRHTHQTLDSRTEQ